MIIFKKLKKLNDSFESKQSSDNFFFSLVHSDFYSISGKFTINYLKLLVNMREKCIEPRKNKVHLLLCSLIYSVGTRKVVLADKFSRFYVTFKWKFYKLDQNKLDVFMFKKRKHFVFVGWKKIFEENSNKCF